MQYPFGAVGQFAVGAVQAFGLHIIIDVPASRAIAVAPIGIIEAGVNIDVSASGALAFAPQPEIGQSAGFDVPPSVVRASTPVPAVAAGVSIIVNSEVMMFSPFGPPGYQAVGLFAPGTGPILSRLVDISSKALAKMQSPFIDAGASVLVGLSANSNSPVNEIDARHRKLRILAVAS